MSQAPKNKPQLQSQLDIEVWSTERQQPHPPAGLSPAMKYWSTPLHNRGSILYKATVWMPEPLGFFQKCKWALLCKGYRLSTACELSLHNLSSLVRFRQLYCLSHTEFYHEDKHSRDWRTQWWDYGDLVTKVLLLLWLILSLGCGLNLGKFGACISLCLCFLNFKWHSCSSCIFVLKQRGSISRALKAYSSVDISWVFHIDI